MKMEVTGLDETIAAYERLGEQLHDQISVDLRQLAQDVRNDLSIYPPQRPPANPKYRYIRGVGTLYVPTGHIRYTSERLGASTFIDVETPMTISVNSPASYASYVWGDEDNAPDHQAWMHVGNWTLFKDRIEQRLADFAERVEASLQRVLDKV